MTSSMVSGFLLFVRTNDQGYGPGEWQEAGSYRHYAEAVYGADSFASDGKHAAQVRRYETGETLYRTA